METIIQTAERIAAFIKEKHPKADLAPGSALNELIVKLSASAQNEIYNRLETLDSSNAVSKAISATEEQFSPVIDEIASNYNATRGAAGIAGGTVRVFVTSSSSFNIPAGLSFIYSDLELRYKTTIAYTISTAGTAPNLKPVSGVTTLYYFDLVVAAEAGGAGYNLPHGTAVELDSSGGIKNLSSVVVWGGITGGFNLESDQALIARFKLGLATRPLVSSNSINAVLTSNPAFSGMRDTVVFGPNDPELQRNKFNLFGIASLGMVDVYPRTSSSIYTTPIDSLVGQATAVGTGAYREYKIECTKDNTPPGFYDVVSVLTDNNQLGNLQHNVVYGFSEEGPTTDNNFVPNATIARFSIRQTADILVKVPIALVPLNTDGDPAPIDFIVTFAHLPYIKEIQNLFLSSADRIACADYFVKAIVPCLVSVKVTLTRKYPFQEIPVAMIKKDIFNYITSLSINEPLKASKIIDICHNYNVAQVSLPIHLEGVIVPPTINHNDRIVINSEDQLIVPTQLDVGVSPRNTAFFASYADEEIFKDVVTSIGIIVV